MRIRAVSVRRFRSIERAGLAGCGGLNVLIGKNNSGKSNLLSTIDLAHGHLHGTSIAGPWNSQRPVDEFTNRNCEEPVQIGLEFELPADLNLALRDRLKAEAPHLEKSIELLKTESSIVFVIAAVRVNGAAFLFVQHIAVGHLKTDAAEVTTEGINLLTVPQNVAQELFVSQQETNGLRADVRVLDMVLNDPSRLGVLFENRERGSRFYWEGLYGREARESLVRQISQLAPASTSVEELQSRLSAFEGDVKGRIDVLQHRETESPMQAFAGATKAPPLYVTWLMQQYGSLKMLHLKETRDPIGREEADALLRLKITRGGPDRLSAVQRTVRTLLGVEVDAFQSEDSRRALRGSAEMDIDQFLVEANGAGIREALRLILDLELKRPDLLLIEEPEVHLHPGLEHAVYSYLRDKSQDVQMFVTTHSTNFVDSVSFQNIYLVSKDSSKGTLCESLDAGDGALKIPAELGLRLSTVFMYDRLVFVEGPSDEAVLRELAKALDLDLAKANVGFVQMGGVRNFAHFAAQSTLDLLTRRRILMWFVADRDERDDEDVKLMLTRLGGAASLRVLKRREMENYLLDPDAVAKFIVDRQAAAGVAAGAQTSVEVGEEIVVAARALKDEVIRLRIQNAVLKPVLLQTRSSQGTVEERLERAVNDLSERLRVLPDTRDSVAKDIEQEWDALAVDRAPGALVLDAVATHFGVRFNKQHGDSARLARLLEKYAVPEELASLLREVAQAQR